MYLQYLYIQLFVSVGKMHCFIFHVIVRLFLSYLHKRPKRPLLTNRVYISTPVGLILAFTSPPVYELCYSTFGVHNILL